MTEAVAIPVSEDERHRLLLEAITDYAIYMLDSAGHVSSWNPGAERFKGYTASEIMGAHFSRFYTEEDRARGLPEEVLRTAANAGRYEGEGWRVRKDGHRFWAHVVVDPIRSPTGDLLGFAKITRDLTERRAREEELRRSQEQFRLLVQGVTDYAIYMLDPKGHVASWNAGAQRIKGYAPWEILGEHFSRFYTEEDREDGLPSRALETARQEGRFEHEGWRVRKDGTRFWASVVVDAIHDDEGELIGFAKVTRDITEKRDAQKALEVAHEELLQSRKMEALGQLAGGIAHDFNNLLMAISGSLELLQRRLPDNPQIASLIDNALQGAQRGSALTGRLLAFARRQPLEPQLVDLPCLVKGLRDLMQLSLGRDIRIELSAQPAVPPVMVDAAQLELALLNIATNARDAMPDGGLLGIRISHEEAPSAHGTDRMLAPRVCLAISDTGEGMDEETLARAADPFFTTKGPGKGTGLGLSVVHGLLEESGGRLVLKSTKGEGTTVEMWFTAASAPQGQLADTSVQTSDKGTVDTPLTVLAVDDDALVLMNTVIMLEDLGYEVIEASSGAEALAKLDEHEVDLLLTDHAMPQMSGAELADAARERHPGLQVVLATGFLELPNDSTCANLPKLMKPFSMEQLQAAIREATSSKQP
ncbi:PAS domain S-box-containing protein [Limimaricola soesokkakensis]|uniref:histidine kinase n=1 Tax=Limimaricola soesokkakensis TaxID=1343159 RepID=A0A1X6Z2V0_9RHOB|nr:PAS domain-containing sensor histidine kinase [Limimaricola soesokkakensis]PSK81816.1 PAS domain S-box-containing protein [Limimaricola soesokkakensis]SLN39214.1 Blue-light-activated protein [Limimaricola soesokkakensis]